MDKDIAERAEALCEAEKRDVIVILDGVNKFFFHYKGDEDHGEEETETIEEDR